MRRRQLVEIEDQPWCPAPIRDGATDYLRFVLDTARPYRAIVERLGAAIRRCRSETIVDLCAGGGGPWTGLLPEVRAAAAGLPRRVVLTDLYPNRLGGKLVAERSGGALELHPDAVDARRVPVALRGFRTLFTSMHHFPPADARRILADAAASGEGIGIFEVTERRVSSLLGMILVPFVILLITPALRPFRWSRLFWTYVIPAIPLVGWIDGMVSCLRSYTADEFLAMTSDLPDHDWEAGRIRAPGLPVAVTCLIGVPRRS